MSSQSSMKVTIAVYFLSFIFFGDGHGDDFGYIGEKGPNSWGEKFHQCAGKHQSPINIDDSKVQTVELLPMVFENFDKAPNFATVKNNGHTVMYTITSDAHPTVSGGPLVGKYEFSQLHFHWGAYDWEGSENTINNNSFPLELHMVFFGSFYGSFENALEHPDGLTVLSFLFSISDEENKEYKFLTDALPKVVDAQASTTIHNATDFESLLIKNRFEYFTFGGSLTTPPCSQVVQWIEFTETISLSHSQIKQFRNITGENGILSHNFRPTQPLYGRIIRLNKPSTRNGTIKLNTLSVYTLALTYLIIMEIHKNVYFKTL